MNKTIIAEHPVAQGYTCAHRRIIEYSDGTRVFAKTATNDETTMWLHKEHTMYLEMGQQPFLAELRGFDSGEDGFPTIYLEDLSHARWPPAWRKGDVARVVEALKQVAQLPVQHALKPIPKKSSVYTGWSTVEEDPEPFLSLGLCSASWLQAALPTLLKIQQGTATTARQVVHRDIRSDNLCFVDDRVVVIDWNWTSLGSDQIDLAFWLPSLQAEGGPTPEEVMPEPGPWAANAASIWACTAGLPQVPEAPRVRYIQKKQLLYALPWAQRAYGLPPLDGDLKAFADALKAQE